ncbi:MAG: carboxypeptidase regulatory-like domain-containing protein [Bacteroidales bacterium]|nr:carboxypeptidase regulatory-like domain-containing protein [Bacteroidales bacterium]
MVKLVKFFSLLLFLCPIILSAQTQTVRGVVIEKSTLEPLPGATVIVTSNDRQFGTSTNEAGEFSVPNVPVGRCNIFVSMVGFVPFASNNILVHSGRETVLEIALDEDVFVLHGVTITPVVDKERPLNALAVVSARMLSSEEANRYAGTFGGDPSRMVVGFAGVVAANDQRNDIIIRGNSPMGLLWRLDGFDIPNPNHFGTMGATGGPVGMLNSNQLANSDFFTGAFPAEFGNALSGVFDLRLRNGNNQNHEFLGSVGMNGFELGAEGPLSRETGASYMVNARYSFLGLLGAMGIFDELGGAIPEYQDLSARINIPLRSGNLSWTTLLGTSRIEQNANFDDPEHGWIPGERGENMLMTNRQVFTGVNYTHRFSATTRLENRLSYQSFLNRITFDGIEYPTGEVFPEIITVNNSESRVAYLATLNHRVNAQNLIRSGVGADVFLLNVHNTFDNTVLNDYSGTSTLLRAFAQWQHRFGSGFSVIPGVYAHYYTFNGDYSIEPRLGFRWDVSRATSFSLGSGLHSQLQPRLVQMFERDGVRQNENLEMTRSWQTVVGFNQRLGTGMRLKVEVYYQSLFNVPVIPDIPEESILNFGDDFNNNWDHVFVNQGTGRNYGIEVTLERFFDNQYYFLLTASLFDSKYTGYDGIERRTRFAGNFALNGLFGYEWRIGERTLLSVNTKASFVGGRRYVPMVRNTLAENLNDLHQLDYSRAYINRLPNYFRWDLNFGMKINYRRFSIEWFAEVNNITNHRNIWSRHFDIARGRYMNMYQYGFMPVGGFRIHF